MESRFKYGAGASANSGKPIILSDLQNGKHRCFRDPVFYRPSISGPWTTNLVPIIAPGNTKKDSWSTQCDFVFPFKGTKDTVFMYDGDRWEKPDPMRPGDYAWLPITFNLKDSVMVNYYQDWEVAPDKGVWRPIDAKRNLALYKTVTASSTSGSDSPNNVTFRGNIRSREKMEIQLIHPIGFFISIGDFHHFGLEYLYLIANSFVGFFRYTQCKTGYISFIYEVLTKISVIEYMHHNGSPVIIKYLKMEYGATKTETIGFLQETF